MSAWGVIPAAGHSRRMGQPKLVLPWKGATVIDAVLQAWCASKVDQVVVVVRPGDHALRDHCLAHGVTVVQPGHEPADMKESLLLGLAYLRASRAPVDSDVWLVAPADMPGLTAEVINAVIDAAPRVPAGIVVPTWGGRRGHPVRLAWPLAAELENLGSDEGLRDLIARHRVAELPLTDPEICHDVDTPADWEAYRQRSAIERPNAEGGESDS